MINECRYLAGMVHLPPGGSGHRIDGFCEPYCLLLHRLPCSQDCLDRNQKG
jgi:hypothetical protein